MHMKEDHMKNGQLKPGYNIQAATTDQYVVDYAIFPNPTDFKILEPVFGHLKNVFGMRRTHLRGKKRSKPILAFMMVLNKYGQRRWMKDHLLLLKI